MQKTKQEAEGKYYCKSEFKTYKGYGPHCERGLAEIAWHPETKKYQVALINFLYPERNPDQLLAVISFEGYFETKTDGKIIEGDNLHLHYIKRIGVQYASQGSEAHGHYQYHVSKVERNPYGHIDSIVVSLATDATKGLIFFERAECE